MGKCPPWSSDGPDTRDGDFQQSCVDAYHAAQACAAKKIITSQHCGTWHKLMFELHVPLAYYAGNFRQQNPLWPCLDVNVQVAGIQGEPPDRVGYEIERLFEFVHQQLTSMEIKWSELTPKERTIRLAVILGHLVGRFIQIHPFINGNGRTSRLLWAWGLMRFGVPPQTRVRLHPENPTYDFVMSQAMQGDSSHVSLFILDHLAANPPRMDSSKN